MMESTTRFFDSGNTRLAYRIAGCGPLIVYLHGVGGNKSNWAQQFVALSRDYCCVALDARGYGESGDPDRPIQFGDFADDVAALLDHLGARRGHIVGLSMGGFVAQDFAARYSDRLATLTLAGTSLGGGRMPKDERESFLKMRLGPLDAGASMDDVAQGVVKVLAGRRATDIIAKRLRASTAAIKPQTYRQALSAIVTTDYSDTTPSIDCPTLVIVGEDDRVLPVAESRSLAALIRGSRLVIIPQAGHLCNIEAPEAFNAALVEILSDDTASPAAHVKS